MNQILFNGVVIYDYRLANEEDKYIVRDTNLHLRTGSAGSLRFTIENDHTAAHLLTKMKGLIEVLSDDETVFRGRIVRDTKGFYNSRTIECEEALAFLNDSVIPPFAFPDDFQSVAAYQTAASEGNVVEYFLSWLLELHNSQVTEEQQIQLGNVTVTDPNNYIARSSSDYATTWDTIQEKLTGSMLGGHLMVRYGNNGTYLDYVDEFPLTNVQNIEFSENLLDIVSDVDATEIYTVILPIGADGLKIGSLADGPIDSDLMKVGDTIYSTSGIDTYGRITRVVKWDDVSVDTNLRAKAATALATSAFSHSITVQACDLHGVDGSIPNFRVGRNILLESEPHGLSAVFPLLEIDQDLLDPASITLTLGREAESQTDDNQKYRIKMAEKAAAQQLEINQTTQGLSTAITTLTEQITTAVQNSQGLVFSALENYVKTGDLETLMRQVSTQFEQTSDQIQMTFKTLTDEIANVSGDLQRKYDERVSYIRFIDGTIILGEAGNEITLTIDNDRMTFRQNGQEVAWFSNNQFYITDAEITERLDLGPWRLNTANGLTVKWHR